MATANSSLDPAAGTGDRRPWLAFLGPACLVSVGYMDPGNWATDLEGGARFGYELIWVLVASNVMALLLQSLSARLGLVTGLDLASGCRAAYTPGVSVGLWILAELAIVACDLAELLGSAIALNLLFGIPLIGGALLTSLDVILILGLQRIGVHWLEAVVLVLLLTIAACLGVELIWAAPSPSAMASGLAPRWNGESLYVAIGILGATVMPHNLYLQSGLLKEASRGRGVTRLRRALSKSFWSTALALNLALLVNGAILVLAASAFGSRGLEVTDLKEAHHLLAPILGGSAASVLFAVGLLCAGQSATVTGTLAGQLVMEGFIHLKVSPWLRRLVTRALAIVPAIAVLSWVGERGSMALLLGSQIVLSIQLPFAIVPLIRLTSSPRLLGRFSVRPITRYAAITCASLVTLANAALIQRTVRELSPAHPQLASLLAAVASAGLVFLGWITLVPLRAPAAVPRASAAAVTAPLG